MKTYPTTVLNRYFILFVTMGVMACSTSKCREQKNTTGPNETTPSQTKAAAELSTIQPGTYKESSAKVFKYDGSKQCGEAPGIELEAMKKQLQNIRVISQTKLNDGKMHIQMCGADTGQINVYEIPNSELQAALKLGFKEWKK